MFRHAVNLVVAFASFNLAMHSAQLLLFRRPLVTGLELSMETQAYVAAVGAVLAILGSWFVVRTGQAFAAWCGAEARIAVDLLALFAKIALYRRRRLPLAYRIRF